MNGSERLQGQQSGKPGVSGQHDDPVLERKFQDAIWVGQALFDRKQGERLVGQHEFSP